MDIHSLTSNLRWLFIGTILSNIISIIITIYIIRLLPVEAFGIYSMFLGSMGFFSVIANSGLIVSLRRYIPELLQKGYYKYLLKLILYLYIIALVISIILIVVVFFNKKEIGILLNINKFDLYYTIFMINIFLFLQSSISSTILVAMFEQKTVSLLALFSVIVRGLLYFVLINQITLELIFIIEAATLGVTAIPGLWIMFKKLIKYSQQERGSIPNEERRKNRKRVTRYALLSTSNEMGSSALSEVSDYYFITAYLGPAALGLYAFPYKLINSVFHWIPMNQINNNIRSYFIKKYYSSEEKNLYLNKMFNFLLKIFVLLYGSIIGIIIGYQKLVNIYLFDSKYLSTQVLLAVLVFFYALNSIAEPVNLVMETTERIQYNLYSKIFAVFNVFAVIAVLEFTDWGILGVAIATGISKFLKNYYIYYFLKKLEQVEINTSQLLKIIFIVVPVIIIMYLASLPPNLFLNITLPAISGMLASLLLFYMIKPFNEEEGLILQKTFRKVLEPSLTLRKKFFVWENK